MASILRQIVAGPRARHAESKLDLCYVTDNIIATSGPSSSYPSLAYRNPLSDLVRFLDAKHGAQWAIWEFRAEGTGYDDAEVHGRVLHFPWPDHHPPPFGLVPRIVGTMRDWIHGTEEDEASEVHETAAEEKGGEKGGEKEGARGGKGGTAGDHRVIVVHCKAGKGRSGTAAISYLISQEGWDRTRAMDRFTERRMRPGFGKGLSIPSQIRWIGYTERWARLGGKRYKEQSVEITEVHVWGLRDGVKIAVEGYIDAGKRINNFHTFDKSERDDKGMSTAAPDQEQNSSRFDNRSSQTDISPSSGSATPQQTKYQASLASEPGQNSGTATPLSVAESASSTGMINNGNENGNGNGGGSAAKLARQGTSSPTVNVIYRPSKRIILPTSDVNIAIERRTRGGYVPGMVTSIAHAWFNCFFEGQGPERYAKWKENLPLSESLAINETTYIPPEAQPEDSGIIEAIWETMDGIKGSSRKGAKAFDRIAIVWRLVPEAERKDLPVVEIELAAPLDAAVKSSILESKKRNKLLTADQQDIPGGKRTTLEDLVQGNNPATAGGRTADENVNSNSDPATAAATTTTAVATDTMKPDKLEVPLSEALHVDSDDELEAVKSNVADAATDD